MYIDTCVSNSCYPIVSLSVLPCVTVFVLLHCLNLLEWFFATLFILPIICFLDQIQSTSLLPIFSFMFLCLVVYSSYDSPSLLICPDHSFLCFLFFLCQVILPNIPFLIDLSRSLLIFSFLFLFHCTY